MRICDAAAILDVVERRRKDVTFIWFVVWLIADLVGDRETLAADPVNVWSATLLLAVALDLGSRHAVDRTRRRAG